MLLKPQNIYTLFQRLFVFINKNIYLCSKTKKGKVLMNNLIKILITLIVVLNTSFLLSQTTSKKISTTDTLVVKVVGDEIIDTTPYQSIMFHQDSIRKNLNRPYNKDVFNFKYDSFKEKMKDSWIGNILKEIFFR